MTSLLARGHIELTPATFAQYQDHLKTMPQFGVYVPFYNGYPVTKADATANVLVKPDGSSSPLLFKGKPHEQSSLF